MDVVHHVAPTKFVWIIERILINRGKNAMTFDTAQTFMRF